MEGSEVSHSTSESNERNRFRLIATTRRLNEFADSLIDPANEGDPFYQTVLSIHRYFGGAFSIVSILAAIHFHAGNVEAAVVYLSNQPNSVPHEELEFDFRSVNGTEQDRSTYFSFG
jgi:hypothetical protein